MSGLFDDLVGSSGGLFDDLIPLPQPDPTPTPPRQPPTPAFNPVANLVMDSLNGQGPAPDAPRRVVPLDALQDERPPNTSVDLGAGSVMRAALARSMGPTGEGSVVLGEGARMTGQDRSHLLRMTQNMPQEAQMAVMSFVNEAVTSGQMTATEAMIYAMENLQEGTKQVPRTGPRGWLGGTKPQPTYNVGAPALPEGFVLD